MSSPTSTKTSWLREKLSRRTSVINLSVTNSTLLTEVEPVPFEEDINQDSVDLTDWEVLTLAKSRTTNMEPDGRQSTSASGRKVSGGQSKFGVLSSPILGSRSSSVVSRPSIKQDKKFDKDFLERPLSAGPVVHRSTSKKKLLTVNNSPSNRTPSPGLERSSSQRSSQRHKSRDNQKMSSPGPREISPVGNDQGSAFSKVRDTLRIRKIKKKASSSKMAAYSVPVLDLPNKYQDPFEPDLSGHDVSDEGTGHEFNFVNVPHYHPEYCDHCQQAAWGHHQVLKCNKCDFICHKKCEGRVFMKCTSKLESDALLQQDRTKESFEESAEILTEKDMKSMPDGGGTTIITQPPSEKAILAKKIREYNRRITPVHQIHTKHRDALIDYQGFVRVHMCIQRPIHVSTGVTRTSWYRLMRPVKERSIDSGIDAGLETAFYLPTDTNRLVHISNVTTTKDLISTLLKKFCITDNPKKFSLYEEYGSDSRRLFDEDHPLQQVLEASVVGRNSKLALRDNLCSTIQWDAFSVPELQNFITILGREEGLYAERLKDCFLSWKKHLYDELTDKGGSHPYRSTSGPLSESIGHPLERSTSDPLTNGESHPLAASHHARPLKAWLEVMSVKKVLRQYRLLQEDLNGRLEELELKREVLHSSLPPSFDESVTIEMRLEEDIDAQHQLQMIKMKRERLKATEVLLSILQLKNTFIANMVSRLESFAQDNPQNHRTPFDLQLARFYDWVETNQQIYELNTQLYEIEKSKWNMEKPHRQHNALATPIDHSIDPLSVEFKQFDSSVTAVSLYVSERLQPRDCRMTFEATKIEEYIVECNLYQGGTLESPPKDSLGVVRGAHPQSYHAFIEVLCNYIVERHRSSQGEDLPYATIYTAIEHNLMPRIKHYVLKYICKAEEDRILHEQCLRFEDVTLSQLRIPIALRSNELVPFADAISYMRATYFSQSPTDKMYSVVAAAKALHGQLSAMEEGSIDGDTFLDFWVYVTLKANVRDMATNVTFMSEYGNPQLSIAEAGYYLTTLYAAISYIKSLTTENLKKQEENDCQFVMCEIEEAQLLTSQEGTCMELIGLTVLVGYVAAAIKKWLMDSSRLYSTVLIETGDINDSVQVAVIRLSSDKSSSCHVEYFYEALTTNHDIPGVSCRCIKEGLVMLADPQQCGDKLIYLHTGNASEQLPNLRYAIQLIRMGSERIEDDDESLLMHHSLPHSISTSPYSLIPSPNGEMSSIEAQLDSDDRSTRSRFSLPTKSQLRKLIQRKGNSSGSFQNAPPLSDRITVTAEVHNSNSESQDVIEKDKGKKFSARNTPQRSIEISDSVSCASSDFSKYESSVTDLLYLEQNYMENHLYGNQKQSVRESVTEVIKLCQMMLQRLNFLSSVHTLNGIYDDATVNAVQSFQVLHNEQDEFSSIQLPESGVLSIATLQYLRQELLTIFANLMRLRKDLGLNALSNFDPLSIDPDDMRQFFDVVANVQKKLQLPQTGTLCVKTITHMKKLLRNQTTINVRSDRGNTL